jgi:hypothetical protein
MKVGRARMRAPASRKSAAPRYGAVRPGSYGVSCYLKPGQLRGAYGNEVTGDGTSTISDCPGATNPVFVIIS